MSILTITDGLVRPYFIPTDNIPRFVPSSGSIGDNGALTLSTALDLNAYDSSYQYFPANAIAVGVAAGLYYVQMSSATVGTIYNNTYTGGIATIPASPTAFVTTGPGAYTQTTAADITLLSFTLPANTLGANGSMFVYPHVACATSGSNKIIRMKAGATTLSSLGLAGHLQSSTPFTFRNKGVVNRNVSNGASGFSTSVGASPTHTTIDTSSDQTITLTVQLAAATDYCGIVGSLVQINPSA